MEKPRDQHDGWYGGRPDSPGDTMAAGHPESATKAAEVLLAEETAEAAGQEGVATATAAMKIEIVKFENGNFRKWNINYKFKKIELLKKNFEK